MSARVAVTLSVAALVAVVTAGLGVLAGRRPAGALPDLDGYLDRWSGLHGGYDPRTARLAGTWLRLAYRLARPLASAGVHPDAVTGWGLAVSLAVLPAAAAQGRWALLGVLLVVLSGLLDNLDGAVATLGGRVSAFGYVLDSVVDRLADAAYLVALWLLGAPPWLSVAAGGAVWLLEYVRARAGTAGFRDIGVVTVGERPTRVIVTAAGLLVAGLWPRWAGAVAAVTAAATGGLALLGLAQLLPVVRRALSR